MSSLVVTPGSSEVNKCNTNKGKNNKEFISLKKIFNAINDRGTIGVNELRLKVSDYKQFFVRNFHKLHRQHIIHNLSELIKVFWEYVAAFTLKTKVIDGKSPPSNDFSFVMFRAYLNKRILNTQRLFGLESKGKKKPVSKKFEDRKVLISNSVDANSTGEYKLFVNCSPITIKSLRIRENPPNLQWSEGPARKWHHTAFTTKTLINWPYIGFQLILPEVVFSHNVDNIYKRFLYLKGAEEKNIVTENNVDVFIERNVDYQSCKPVSANLLKNYLTVLRKVVKDLPNFTKRRKSEVLAILTAVIHDIEVTKAQCLYVDLDCVNVLNKYNYYRKYDTDPKEVEEGSPAPEEADQQVTEIKEIVTPQVHFVLKRSSFENDNIDFCFNNVIKYFNNIFGDDKDSINRFYETMKKCIRYTCSLCNKQFEGVLASYSLEDHIRLHHGPENNWSCVNCKKSFDPSWLSSARWAHTCKTTTQD